MDTVSARSAARSVDSAADDRRDPGRGRSDEYPDDLEGHGAEEHSTADRDEVSSNPATRPRTTDQNSGVVSTSASTRIATSTAPRNAFEAWNERNAAASVCSKWRTTAVQRKIPPKTTTVAA